jgi:outer membrane receptor protein involved in Fe transport
VESDDYHQNQDSLELGARLQRQLSPRISSESVLLEQLGWGNIDDVFATSPSVAAATGDDESDLFSEHKRRGETIASTKVRVDFNPSLSLNTGIEGAYNWLTTTTTFVEDGVPMVLPAADVHVTEARTEATALVDWRPKPTLNLEMGGKVEASRIVSTGDVNAAKTFVYPKPTLLIAWSPSPADQLRLRVERRVGQLNFDDYTANAGYIATGSVRAGNPRLTPQQDWVFEGVAERSFWSAGDVSVTARHYELSDVIDRIEAIGPSGPYDAPGNIGSGRRDDVAVALTLPLDRVGFARALLTGQTTFRWSRVTDPITGLSRPISGLHSNDWELHLIQALPRLKSTWGFDIIGPTIETNYRFDEVDTDKLGAFVSPFVEYRPRPDLSFRIELRNLLDRRVEHSRLVYDDVRTTSPLDFDELRLLRAGRFVFVRVVKSLQ